MIISYSDETTSVLELMDQWEAQILACVMCKAECYFVTEPENRELIESMHMRYAPDVDTALQMASERLGDHATVTAIPDGVGVIVSKTKNTDKHSRTL